MVVGVSQMATRTQGGSSVAKPHFPSAVVLDPGLNDVDKNQLHLSAVEVGGGRHGIARAGGP